MGRIFARFTAMGEEELQEAMRLGKERQARLNPDRADTIDLDGTPRLVLLRCKLFVF